MRCNQPTNLSLQRVQIVGWREYLPADGGEIMFRCRPPCKRWSSAPAWGGDASTGGGIPISSLPWVPIVWIMMTDPWKHFVPESPPCPYFVYRCYQKGLLSYQTFSPSLYDCTGTDF